MGAAGALGLALHLRNDRPGPRQARLAGPEAELKVYNFFGTVRVIVPEGVKVSVRGGGLFASEKIESPVTPAIPGGPKLRIELSGVGGTLDVRSRPSAAVGLKSAVKRALGKG